MHFAIVVNNIEIVKLLLSLPSIDVNSPLIYIILFFLIQFQNLLINIIPKIFVFIQFEINYLNTNDLAI